jgi:hypothetical protein
VSAQKPQESQEVDTSFELRKFFYIVVVCVVFFVMLALYVHQFGPTLSTDQATWGAFGDYIGGLLNPTIAFFTLMVAVQVWRLQKKELKETKDTLRRQLDIDIVFRQMQIHQSLVENLIHSNTKGRASFSSFCNEIWESSSTPWLNDLVWATLDKKLDWTSNNDFATPEATEVPEHIRFVYMFQFAYETGIQGNDGSNTPIEFLLGHYLRSVYAILKNIQESQNLSLLDKSTLIEVLRSQIGEEEFVLLAANGGTKRGRKFRARALRSNLFQSRLTTHKIGKSFTSCYESNLENLKWADKVLAED